MKKCFVAKISKITPRQSRIKMNLRTKLDQVIKVFSKSGEERYFVQDGILEFKNNNLSILTSSIFDTKNIDKNKINEILKDAEKELFNKEIDDQKKYLIDQKIEVLKSLSLS